MSNPIPMPELPLALSKHGVSMTYQQLWHARVQGKIPAYKRGSRWYVRSADLPAMAAAFLAENQ